MPRSAVRSRPEPTSPNLFPSEAATGIARTISTLTAYVEHDPETGLYVGVVPGVPGTHSQGATLDELNANPREVTELLLEEDASLRERLPRFVGLQQVEVV